jgi:hypothetical protein
MCAINLVSYLYYQSLNQLRITEDVSETITIDWLINLTGK